MTRDIYGQLKDATTGQAIDVALLSVVDQNGQLLGNMPTATSDGNGEFGFEAAQHGLVHISHVSYVDKTVAVVDFTAGYETIEMVPKVNQIPMATIRPDAPKFNWKRAAILFGAVIALALAFRD